MLRYLSRYTHRIAISNRRLVTSDDTRVGFTWKDYRDGSKQKCMTLDAHEFIRRFWLARSARRLPAHQALRVPRQRSSQGEARDYPPLA